MHKRTLTRLATIGLASAMIVPAAAAAQPLDGQAIAAGGGPGVTAQTFRSPSEGRGVTGEDYRALNQAPSGLQATAQDLRAPDQVAPATPSKSVPGAAPRWPVHPQTLKSPAPATSSSSSDDGTIDTAWLIGFGGLAVGCLGGLGLVYRIRVRTARQRVAA